MDYEKEIPFGAFDSELMHQEISIPEGFTATIEGNKIILTKTESEDEKIRKALIEYFNEQCDMSDWNGVYGYQVIAWLEKQGKEDSFIQQAYEQGYTEGKRIERKHWIEKQNFSEDYNSIDPQFGKPIEQNPAEWSEEDDGMLDTVGGWLDTLCEYLKDGSPECIEYVESCINWLKSLKQRIGRKPSDEQMKALDSVIDEYDGYPEFDSLVSLKNDLRKL